MTKEVISDSQGISLIVMFIGGTTSLLTLGISAKQNFWLAIILATLISVPIFLLFARLYHIFPGKNFFDIIELCFGKIIGKVIIILFTLFCLDEGTEVLINAGSFISTTSLMETPRIVLGISMIILSVWAAKEGIEVLGRWAQAMRIPFIFIIVISLIFLIPSMDITNIRPLFTEDTKTILKGTLSTFTFPFGEIFVFAIAFAGFRKPKTSYKVYLMGLLLGSMIPLLISTTNVLVLGVDDASTYFHPTYFALRRISLGTVFQRIEVLASVVYILGTFVKVTIYLVALSKGISKIFGFDDYRFIVFPAGLLIVNLSYFYFKDMLKYWEYTEKVWVYYSIPFEVVLPIIIFIVAEIRKKKLTLKLIE